MSATSDKKVTPCFRRYFSVSGTHKKNSVVDVVESTNETVSCYLLPLVTQTVQEIKKISSKHKKRCTFILGPGYRNEKHIADTQCGFSGSYSYSYKGTNNQGTNNQGTNNQRCYENGVDTADRELAEEGGITFINKKDVCLMINVTVNNVQIDVYCTDVSNCRAVTKAEKNAEDALSKDGTRCRIDEDGTKWYDDRSKKVLIIVYGPKKPMIALMKSVQYKLSSFETTIYISMMSTSKLPSWSLHYEKYIKNKSSERFPVFKESSVE